MTLTRLLAIVSVVLLLTEAGSGQGRSLRILLTNDDGVDSAGLAAMRTALIAAGHQVTVVAPATNMSSTGMSMTSGVLTLEKRADGVWAVRGTPADAATIGLQHVLRDTPQDLVISGTNAGQNLGTSTNSSGTVSAAIAAARYGVPAIATSAGIGRDATGAYAAAATLTTQMIVALVQSRPAGGKLLPDGIVINVNVPLGRLAGLKWAPLSNRSAFTRSYSDTGTPGEVRSALALSAGAAPEADSDLSWFNQGYITLTLLDGDLSVGASPAAAGIVARLSSLTVPQAAGVK